MLLLPYIVSSVAVNKLTVMYNALYYYPVENGALPIWILWTEAHEKKNAPFHCLHVLPLIHTSVCASCSILALSSSHIHAHTLVLTHSLSDPPLFVMCGWLGAALLCLCPIFFGMSPSNFLVYSTAWCFSVLLLPSMQKKFKIWIKTLQLL